MSGWNEATLVGNLGASPELRFTQNNKAVLKLRLATTTVYIDGKGEKKEDTQWHNVLLWGKRAEGLSKLLDKGSRLGVKGRITNRTYDDKDGVKRSISEIVATDILLLDAKKEGMAGGFGRPSTARGGQTQNGGAPPKGDEPDPNDFGPGADDDIPF